MHLIKLSGTGPKLLILYGHQTEKKNLIMEQMAAKPWLEGTILRPYLECIAMEKPSETPCKCRDMPARSLM
jgi:hypothetical protein